MGDNLHPLDTEVIDQDILEANVATLTTQVNSNTTAIAGINLTNINNQLAGSASSGLLTQIQGNDTDIEGINDKLDATTGSGLKTLIDNKVSMVLGTSAGTALEGNTPTITTAQANKITANENAIDAIELKTDFLDVGNNGLKYSHGNFLTGSSPGDQLLIQHADLNGGSLSNNFCSMRVTANGELRLNVPTGQDYEFRINNVFQYNNTQIKNLIDNVSVTGGVNLDTIESDVTGIKNNTLASTLKTAVDGNTSSASQNQIVISATATKVANIVGSSTAPAPTDNLVIGSGGATNRYVRIGYANQSNRVGFANEAYFTGGGVYAVEQDLNGDLYLDGYKIEIGSQNLNLTTMNNSIATNASNINQAGINSNNQLATINGIKNNTLASTLKTAVDANSAKTGITAQQASDITANNAKTGITAQQASDITANNAKVGITTQQANDITANNAKTGITAQQASDITANNAKNTFPSGLNSLISRGTNQTLEVGTGSGVPRIRLRGQNGVTNSSELIFIDFINKC